eukprot:SAG31_NODE_3913_length_3756_cov_1.959256_3_plen_91_part_00
MVEFADPLILPSLHTGEHGPVRRHAIRSIFLSIPAVREHFLRTAILQLVNQCAVEETLVVRGSLDLIVRARVLRSGEVSAILQVLPSFQR